MIRPEIDKINSDGQKKKSVQQSDDRVGDTEIDLGKLKAFKRCNKWWGTLNIFYFYFIFHQGHIMTGPKSMPLTGFKSAL